MPKSHHTWSLAERHYLHIARTETDLCDSDLTRLFAHSFQSGFWPDGLPSQLRLKDEYEQRGQVGRSKMWELDIVRGGYSTTQEQDRQHARDNIKTAAETLGLTVPWNDPPRFASVSRPPAPRTIRETAPRMSRTLLSGSATSSIANTRKRTRDSTTAYDYDATSEAVLNEPKRARTNKSTSCRSGGDAWLQSFGEQNEGETRYPTISSQQTGIDRGAFASNNVSRGDNDLASPAMQSVSSNDRGNATATSDQPQLPSHYGGVPRDGIGPYLLNILDRQACLRAGASSDVASP